MLCRMRLQQCRCFVSSSVELSSSSTGSSNITKSNSASGGTEDGTGLPPLVQDGDVGALLLPALAQLLPQVMTTLSEAVLHAEFLEEEEKEEKEEKKADSREFDEILRQIQTFLPQAVHYAKRISGASLAILRVHNHASGEGSVLVSSEDWPGACDDGDTAHSNRGTPHLSNDVWWEKLHAYASLHRVRTPPLMPASHSPLLSSIFRCRTPFNLRD